MLKASQTGNDNASHKAGHSSPPLQPAAPAQRTGTFHKEAFQSPRAGRVSHFSAEDSADAIENGQAPAFSGANDSLDLVRKAFTAEDEHLGHQSFHYKNDEINVFNTTFHGHENSGLGERDLQTDNLDLSEFHLPRDLQGGSLPGDGRDLPPTPANSPQRWTLPYELTVGDSESPEFSFQLPVRSLTLNEAWLDAEPVQRTGGIEEAATL